MQDITERKSMELALRESEACFRLLAEGTRNVVWISDPAITRILCMSPSFSKVWGLDADALRAIPSLWQTLVHPEDRHLVHQAFLRQIDGLQVEIEFRIVRPDGQLRWLSIRSQGTTTNRGERIVCGITEDITQRKLADLRKAEDALRQRDTATLSSGLRKAGYDVITASNGHDAIKLIEAGDKAIDLAILDVRMSGIDGITLARHLREHTHLPFMFLSAYGDVDLVKQALALGGLGYLVKPTDVPQIVPSIEAALARSR